MPWTQVYNPLHNMVLSVLAAAIPLVVVAYMLGVKKIPSHKSTGAGVIAVLIVAFTVFHMPGMLLFHSAASGVVVGLTFADVIIGAITFYITINKTGHFAVIRKSILMVTPDPRVQVLLIAFCFGAFLEAIAGGGTPVVITVAMLVGIGFLPFHAAKICLLANSTPVGFGAIGLPAIVLAMVTKLPLMDISRMTAKQIPVISLIIPTLLVGILFGWKGIKGVWPAIAVTTIVFSGAQFLVAMYLGPLLPDVIASIAALVALVVLQRFWKPKEIWKFEPKPESLGAMAARSPAASSSQAAQAHGAHMPPADLGGDDKIPTRKEILAAWFPMLVLVIVVGLWGYPSTSEFLRSTDIAFRWPGLHNLVVAVPPIEPKATAISGMTRITWLSNCGSGLIIASFLVVVLTKGISHVGIAWQAIIQSCRQLKYAIATDIFATSLAWVMNYAGLTATLALAFAATGVALPFFSAYLGWMGVFITGSDSKANALFGNLQALTARQAGLPAILTACTNSTGGAIGKMVSPLELAVATSAGGLAGKEGDLFRAVLGYSLALTAVAGTLAMLQAYVFPFVIPVVK
ncbi:MAG: L-lactate permease [Candidatus Korobacteraceae bacterium]